MTTLITAKGIDVFSLEFDMPLVLELSKYKVSGKLMVQVLKYILAFLAASPFILGLLLIVAPDVGLIFVFLEAVISMPVSWIGEPLFIFVRDIGAYLNSWAGRGIVACFYGFIYFTVALVERWRLTIALSRR